MKIKICGMKMENKRFNHNKCEEVSCVLKAVSHPGRLQILCALMENELNVTQIVDISELSQSQSSQFLKRLQREGLLSCRKESGHTYYQVTNPQVKSLIKALYRIFN
jgi:DNA-binding transcriptional ArsR family regulator